MLEEDIRKDMSQKVQDLISHLVIKPMVKAYPLGQKAYEVIKLLGPEIAVSNLKVVVKVHNDSSANAEFIKEIRKQEAEVIACLMTGELNLKSQTEPVLSDESQSIVTEWKTRKAELDMDTDISTAYQGIKEFMNERYPQEEEEPEEIAQEPYGE